MEEARHTITLERDFRPKTIGLGTLWETTQVFFAITFLPWFQKADAVHKFTFGHLSPHARL